MAPSSGPSSGHREAALMTLGKKPRPLNQINLESLLCCFTGCVTLTSLSIPRSLCVLICKMGVILASGTDCQD